MHMKKLLSYLFLPAVFVGMFLIGADASARGVDPLGLGYGAATGLGDDDIRITIANIIKVALSLLGLVTVVIMIWAGFEWMTAGGNEEKVENAKRRITQAVIGLAIVLSAYAITNFVVKNLFEATTRNAYQAGTTLPAK